MSYLESNSTSSLVLESIETSGEQQVFPSLVSAYHEHGYEAGYARGVNDVLAAVLESTEDFVRLQPESAAQMRRLPHAFSRYLEGQVRQSPIHSERYFSDGLGI